jgi:hypothetical protein
LRFTSRTILSITGLMSRDVSALSNR